MKIVIDIPDEVDDKQIEKELDNLNSTLGNIDSRITIRHYADEEIVIEESVNEIYMEEFIDEEELEDYTILSPLDETLKTIIKKVHDDVYNANFYAKLNGGFSTMEDVRAVRFTDKDGTKKIRFFSRVVHGICDEDGTESRCFYTSSLWTEDGELIKCYD